MNRFLGLSLGALFLGACARSGELARKEGADMSCCGTQTVETKGGCCASAGGNKAQVSPAPARTLEVEYLYLDLSLCTRCLGTESILNEALAEARRILEPLGVEVSFTMTHVRTEEQAKRLEFVSSPTIRINGRDAALEVRENACPSCTAPAGSATRCRVWTWRGKDYDVPPAPMILEAILRHAYGHAPDEAA